MIIKNWMAKNPNTISSDLSAREALNVFDEIRTPFVSVVDDGKFRGILARRDLREAAAWAISTQDIHEMEFFNNVLKVRDIMVRKPVTLVVDDSVQTALEKGSQFGRSFLPVMDDDGRLVGSMSNRDYISGLSQMFGDDEGQHSITLEVNGDSGTSIKTILENLFMADIKIDGLLTLRTPGTRKKRLIIRFKTKCLKKITTLIDEKGYNLVEIIKSQSED